MKINDLIQHLQRFRDVHGPDIVVCLGDGLEDFEILLTDIRSDEDKKVIEPRLHLYV